MIETADPSMTSTSTIFDMSLHLPRHPTDGATKVTQFPMHRVTNNAIAKYALNYSIVDDLAQYPRAMSTLKVLKTFPSQHKALLCMLHVFDPSDSRLITFNLDRGEP